MSGKNGFGALFQHQEVSQRYSHLLEVYDVQQELYLGMYIGFCLQFTFGLLYQAQFQSISQGSHLVSQRYI